MRHEVVMGNSVNTKLAINLAEGTVEVEGSEDFVRFIYQDFKDSLSKQVIIRPARPPTLEHTPLEPRLIENENKESSKKSSADKKASPTSEGKRSRSSVYKPKFNSKLNLAGLDEYFDELKPKSTSEAIVVFAAFLRDRLQMVTCSADDIYTCFFTLKSKLKIPTAFQQAFHDAKRRTHFINYDSLDSISVSIAGDNWLEAQAKKAKERDK